MKVLEAMHKGGTDFSASDFRNRTLAQAAAQAEEPEACVSPAPRSQIRMEMAFGPMGAASWTLVRFGKIV